MTRKFRWSVNGGTSWNYEDQNLPYNLVGVTADQAVVVEPIGAAVSLASGFSLGEQLPVLPSLYTFGGFNFAVLPDTDRRPENATFTNPAGKGSGWLRFEGAIGDNNSTETGLIRVGLDGYPTNLNDNFQTEFDLYPESNWLPTPSDWWNFHELHAKKDPAYPSEYAGIGPLAMLIQQSGGNVVIRTYVRYCDEDALTGGGDITQLQYTTTLASLGFVQGDDLNFRAVTKMSTAQNADGSVEIWVGRNGGAKTKIVNETATRFGFGSRRKLYTQYRLYASERADPMVYYLRLLSISSSSLSTKRLVPVDANNFQINQPAGNGKVLSMQMIRNTGTTDAGPAHDPWRKGPLWLLDKLTDSYVTGGFQPVAGSNGSQDYAMKLSGSPDIFGGSTHGGETNVSETIKADGVVVDGLSAVEAKLFEFQRQTTITWSTTGDVCNVDFKMSVEDLKTTMDYIVSGTFTNALTETYPVTGFIDPRYSRVTIGGVATDVALNFFGPMGAVSDRSIEMMDPETGDKYTFSFTIDRAPSRLMVWRNANYTKFYVEVPRVTPFGTCHLTQTGVYYFAPVPQVPPSLPFVDLFNGSALSSLWKLVAGSSPSSVISGGEWVITSTAVACRWTHPLTLPPGNYRIEIDYATDTAQVCATATVARSKAGSNSNPIVAVQSLNSTVATTMVINLTIEAGQTPHLMIATSATGRIARIREVRVAVAP